MGLKHTRSNPYRIRVCPEIRVRVAALTKKTLQSCTLVSRSFLQCCQMRLFSRISVGDAYLPTFPLACQRLAAVLSSSTHLAGYIQTLELVYDADDSVLVEFFPRILSAVTAVETLQFVRHIDADMWYFPPFDSSMITVFSLPSLRRLELCDWCFRNSLELQALLNRSASLQELTLHNVSFGEVKKRPPEQSLRCAEEHIWSGIGPGVIGFGLRRAVRCRNDAGILHHSGCRASEVSLSFLQSTQ
jgi:hypothetical protein